MDEHDEIMTAEETQEETTAPVSEEVTKETNDPVQETEETPVNDTVQVEEDNTTEIDELPDMKTLGELLRNLADMLKIMEDSWKNAKAEYQVTTDQVNALYQYNNEHLISLDEFRKEHPDASEDAEESDRWDPINGLDHLTEEEVVNIFGEEHPIIGVEHAQTMDRIKTVFAEFHNWIHTLAEYRQVHASYLEAVEIKESAEIEAMEHILEKETDQEKRAKLQKAIQLYYDRKYLDFLGKPLDEDHRDRLVRAYNTAKTIDYYRQRCINKMERMQIAPIFIDQIANLEKQLDPKYLKVNCMLALYFMYIVTYANVESKTDQNRNQAICMVMTLDAYTRKALPEDRYNRVKTNIEHFLDQFLELFPDPAE